MASLPSREKCIELLHRHGTHENILRHCKKVESVAVFLAQRLQEKGEAVDVPLVSRAALLHDIGKAKGLETGESHVSLSKKILLQEGLPRIAEIAGKHGLFQILEEKPFQNWEEKAVFYADKRVMHDRVVSLQERFSYLLQRYGTTAEKRKKIEACRKQVQVLEEKVLGKAGASPALKELEQHG